MLPEELEKEKLLIDKTRFEFEKEHEELKHKLAKESQQVEQLRVLVAVVAIIAPILSSVATVYFLIKHEAKKSTLKNSKLLIKMGTHLLSYLLIIMNRQNKFLKLGIVYILLKRKAMNLHLGGMMLEQHIHIRARGCE